MDRKESNGKRWQCTGMMLTAAIVLSVVTAGIGIGGADPGEVTRIIEPDSVAPGEDVTVTIAFTVPEDFVYLWLRDHVPLGWNVTDMVVNDGPGPVYTDFRTLETMGKVIFVWAPADSGVHIEAVYTLHVPTDAEPGSYPLSGEIGTEIGEVIATIPEGAVVVGGEENVPPTVSDPSADPEVIPDDTDNEPLWGESSTLTVTVTDDSGIMSVTIDLSAIGWSATQPMTNIGGDIWSVTTNASNGTAGWTGTAYEPYQLQVTATDTGGLSDTSVSIPLTVMNNGDVSENGAVTSYDTYHLSMWLLGEPGFELIEEVADVSGNGAVTSYDTYHLSMWLLGEPGFELK